MITVICKRISNGDAPNGGQGAYARDLLAYMTAPENKKLQEATGEKVHTEKCVITVCRNFSKPVMTSKEMAAEMTADCSLVSRLQGGQGIDHWVMSWKATDGDAVGENGIVKAVETWMECMGYGGDYYKWTMSVHVDTDNVHAHIAVCRVNALTGKVKPRGWWKNDNQRALTIIARERGWNLEPGSRFICPKDAEPETIEKLDEVTGEVRVRTQPKVIKLKSDELRLPRQSEKADRYEYYQGEKSGTKLLQEALAEAYAGMKGDFAHMKWGQIHKALAERGILMDRREHRGRHGLVFSLDGEHWQSASKVCPNMAWDKLNGATGAKKDSWRAARADVLDLWRMRSAGHAKNSGGKDEEKFYAALQGVSVKSLDVKVPETTFPEVWLEDKRRKQRIIPVTREIAEKLRTQGIEVLTIPAREWKKAAYKMDKAIEKFKDIPPELLEINAANQATLQKQQEKRRQRAATSGNDAPPSKKTEAPHPSWEYFQSRLGMCVSRIPQWLNAICKDCENYLEIKGEKTPRAGSLMTQMLYEAGGDPSEVSQCVHNFLKRYLGFNREWCIYYEKQEKFYEENGWVFDKTLDNYRRKLFAWNSKLENYAKKLAWHFLPPRMRRGWYYRLPRPTRRPKNRPLSEHEIFAEEWARKRSYEYGRAIFRGVSFRPLRTNGAPHPAPQRADMSPTPRLGM